MRIASVIPGTCPPPLAPLEAAITAERSRVLPLYQCCSTVPAMAHGWEQLLTAVRNRSSLPADVRELVILRVAVVSGAAYEFDAHVPHAQQAGISDDLIASLKNADIDDRFPRRAAAGAAVDRRENAHIVVPPDLFDAVRLHAASSARST